MPDTAARRTSIDSSSGKNRLRPNSEARFKPWTLRQCFFGVSGGIAVDTSSFWFTPEFKLSTQQLVELAKVGLLPEVKDREVEDKSKADSLGKLLVCIQAGWFLLQVIARLAQRLPLTLLEVHVSSQVICAFGMYLCWLKKPYNVEVPHIVEDDKVKDMVGLFLLDAGPWSSTYFERDPDRDRLRRPIPIDKIVDLHKFYQRNRNPSWNTVHMEYSPGMEGEDLRFWQWQRNLWLSKKLDSLSGAWRCLQKKADKDQEAGTGELHLMGLPSQNVALESLTEEQLSRAQQHHKRVNRALDYLRARYFQDIACRSNGSQLPKLKFAFPYGGLDTEFKWKQHDYRYWGATRMVGILSLPYSAIHLSAWNAHFPTSFECWMWRVCTLCMVWYWATIVLKTWFPIVFAIKVDPSDPYSKAIRIDLRNISFWIFFTVFNWSSLITFIVTIFGHFFILVEILASLRSPPVGTYKDIEWSYYVPHLG
ncbi:hypothetical protein IWZ01DRAFT_542466 [Phyllosticta capitalensis]